MAMLGCSQVRNLVFGRRRSRRFWSALRGDGTWETDFLTNYHVMGVEWRVPDFEDEQYIVHLRLGKTEFWRLHDLYGLYLVTKDTRWRCAVASHKRLAMTLHWLAHGYTYSELARVYAVGKSTAVEMVHSTVTILLQRMVKKSIRFPEGDELKRVMLEFGELAHLERCAGAIDGTFMKIKKPHIPYADSYWCYKKYCSIIILGTVDACGIFTNVNAGRAGSAGDAAAFSTSKLCRKIGSRKWLTIDEGDERFVIDGTYIRPYLVADSAFSLCSTTMKCYDEVGVLPAYRRTFNHRLIRTHRVVEQAFGRLKGRFHILVDNNLSDTDFASDVALVCCALHNICERWNCPLENSWLVDDSVYNMYRPGPDDQPRADFDQAGYLVREKMARVIHQHHPVA
ncbi:uncharacterized protein LOC135827649 [Sycon ciliatum]|uniref:uncharacterized protein LOC135827649 n=1 Tax=Sycon ciliatum TaxID=27933 RepID=UPI0031F7101C